MLLNCYYYFLRHAPVHRLILNVYDQDKVSGDDSIGVAQVRPLALSTIVLYYDYKTILL